MAFINVCLSADDLMSETVEKVLFL